MPSEMEQILAMLRGGQAQPMPSMGSRPAPGGFNDAPVMYPPRGGGIAPPPPAYGPSPLGGMMQNRGGGIAPPPGGNAPNGLQNGLGGGGIMDSLTRLLGPR